MSNPIHDDCLMDLKCDCCNAEFCDYCQITCDFDFNDDDRNSNHYEKHCPRCVKKYNIKYEGKCVNNCCSKCYYTDTLYECQKEVNIDICEYCLYSFNYCFDCDIIFCKRSTKHKTHKKLDKLWEHIELLKKEKIQNFEKNVNIRFDIIEIVCDDIHNIDNYMAKYDFQKNDISYGAIMYEMVNSNIDDLKWFIEYLKNKNQDVKTIINTSVMGKYKKEHKQPPIVNVINVNNLKYLIELGGNIHVIGDTDECNILYQNIYIYMYDYYHSDIDTINYLVENGADVNKGDPLRLLARRSQLNKDKERQKIMKLLIENGAIITDKIKLLQPEFFANNY